MDVVLPAPLTPAIITTSGLAPLRLKERSSGRRWSASSWRSAALTLAGPRCVPFHARAQRGEQRLGGLQSGIGHNERRFQFLEQVLVDLHADEQAADALAGARQALLEPAQPGCLFGASCAGGAASATGAETGGGATGATACSTAGATIGTATGATAGATTGAIAGAWTAACAAMGGSMAASGALRASDTGAGAGVAGTGAAAAGSDGAGVTTGAAAGVWAAGGQARMAPREPTTRAYRRRDRLCDGAMLRKRVLEWRARRPSGPARRGSRRLSGVHGRRRRGLDRRGGRRVFLEEAAEHG